MNASPESMLQPASHWRAELSLDFRRSDQRTVLSARHHVGPLLVQRPFYPEGEVCHVYLVHPPGGIAGGDQLRLQVNAAAGSHVLLTTPAATKFYRAAPGRQAGLHQTLTVAGATLEWLPQESLFFCDANARVTTRVELDATARFIGWELGCYGRPEGDQLFTSGWVHQAFELYCEGRPLLLDHLRINAASGVLQAPWGLAGNTALGSLLAYPADASDVEAVRTLGDATTGLAVSLVDRVLVCRVINPGGEAAKRLLLSVWQCLRPRLLNRVAISPRIWAT